MTVNPENGEVTATADSTVEPGSYTVPIQRTFGDGHPDELQVKVIVAQVPVYEPITVAMNEEATVAVPRGNDGNPLPDGTTVDVDGEWPQWAALQQDGSIAVAPTPQNAEPREYTVPVTITVTSASEQYGPGYEAVTAAPGGTVAAPQTVEPQLPEGTRFAIDESFTVPDDWEISLDETTGTITYRAPENAVDEDKSGGSGTATEGAAPNKRRLDEQSGATGSGSSSDVATTGTGNILAIAGLAVGSIV
ncbi:Rib/alpha-like domain-containing protein [Auritidibacter ignavus]|uniref:Rib/alpha-like domain-containing protein n=1 Tax=Auritidibacter ignavus TaxID=678932 RepID=UPI000F042113|nr:Rib/alpha-like domain-containing protein [Auritidibacter ignavus]NIH70973.1 hypothetical protein [Auritidibacter ignavus]RMX24136.1 hypothetical protein DYI20_00760 [Auritidibacter ignavus]